MIRKAFGGIDMTWKKVILFAVAAGIVTALAAMLVPEGNSFHEIAVSFEAWILCAILIIVNCDSAKEAALKTFVFFLISQPLVYLIQVPFEEMGWGLFGYYKYWFIITLLTLPGAYIGWYIKKDNVLAGIILSVMLVFSIFLGAGYLRDLTAHFPNHLISTLFCFGQVPLLIYGVLHDKKARITASLISLAAVIAVAVWLLSGPSLNTQYIYQLDPAQYPVDETWTVRVENEEAGRAELRVSDTDSGGYFLDVFISEPDRNEIVLTDGEGNEYFFTVWVDEEASTVMFVDEQMSSPGE